MIFWITVGILFFALLVQASNFFYFKKNLQKFSKILFFCAIAGILIYYFYLTYAQYQLWKNDVNGIGRFLVPPHESITYVIGYHFMRFALYYGIAFLIALIFLWVTKHYNKKFGEKFFEPEEPYLGALAIFLLGNREWNYAWITYLILILVFSALGSAIFCTWLKKMERFPMYWLWLPAGILAILIGKFVVSSL